MSDVALVGRLEKITDSPAFKEASKEELRVLVAVITLGGKPVSYSDLADMAGVSASRAKSAVTLFIEEGLIGASGEFADVSDEFETKIKTDTSERAAKEIRDSGLADLIHECENVIGVASLSTDDVKAITSLYADEGLAFEYILTVAAYLAGKVTSGRRLTVRRIVSEATKLKEKGIDTREELEIYYLEKEKQIKDEWEYRRVLGIQGTLSDAERQYLDKWAHKYDFSTAVVKYSFELTRVNLAGELSYRYMDKLLTDWHEAGCKTLDDCKKEAERTGALLKEKYEKKDTGKRNNATRVAETPKYSDFNSEDALMKALERSYGKDKN